MTAQEVNDLLHSCGAPLAMFIIGLFFPQVKLSGILEAFRKGAPSDKKED
jgi:hypothetical protein